MYEMQSYPPKSPSKTTDSSEQSKGIRPQTYNENNKYNKDNDINIQLNIIIVFIVLIVFPFLNTNGHE